RTRNHEFSSSSDGPKAITSIPVRVSIGKACSWNSRWNRSCLPGFRLYARNSTVRVLPTLESPAKLTAPAGASKANAAMLPRTTNRNITCPPFTKPENLTAFGTGNRPESDLYGGPCTSRRRRGRRLFPYRTHFNRTPQPRGRHFRGDADRLVEVFCVDQEKAPKLFLRLGKRSVRDRHRFPVDP